MDDENGEYFADVEGDDDEAVDSLGSGINDDDRDGEGDEMDDEEEDADDFVSDSSSIIDELCFGDDEDHRGPPACDGEEDETEVLDGAMVPLSPAEDGLSALGQDGSRRVSIVNGLEEELPVPVIIMVVKWRREFLFLYVDCTARLALLGQRGTFRVFEYWHPSK